MIILRHELLASPSLRAMSLISIIVILLVAIINSSYHNGDDGDEDAQAAYLNLKALI